MLVWSKRPIHVTLVAILAFGTLVTIVNLDQPIVRNSLVYARVAERIIEHSYNPIPIVADESLSHGKPIAFSWFAAPLVHAFGTHIGMKLASFLFTSVFAVSVWYFLNTVDPCRFNELEKAAVLWLTFFNPLMAYQFWSAHPDTLFAALVVFAFTMTHSIAARPERTQILRILLLGAAIYLSILVKYYGVILLLMCPLRILVHLPVFASTARRPRTAFTFLALCFLVVSLLVVLGRIGHNPLLHMVGIGGGVDYIGYRPKAAAVGTMAQLALTTLLNCHVALVFLFFRTTRDRRLVDLVVCFAVPYVVCLFLFLYTYYNMRYFVPILPIVAILLVCGARGASPAMCRRVAGAHLALSVVLILTFNYTPVFERVAVYIPTVKWQRIGWASFLDNMRMAQHRHRAAFLQHINHVVPPGSVLYFVAFRYYGDAQHGVYERAGLIREDIETRYLDADELPPPEDTYYVLYGVADDALAVKSLGRVTDLKQNLFRVEQSPSRVLPEDP